VGEEPIATMVGIVVDASRMHLTKDHWAGLLSDISKLAGRDIVELHSRDFYPGRGAYSGIDGATRAEIISVIFEWLAARKHQVVYAAVVKNAYNTARLAQAIPDELNTIWRFMGFHVTLAMQKFFQVHKKNK